MEFGFYLPNHGPNARPGPLAQIARAGDRLGYYCMVVGDHILVPEQIDSPYPYTASGEFPTGESGEYFEQLTLLTYLAGVTERIRLTPSVMIVPYRPALLAAKVLATLDVLSQGRLILGVGVGWMEEEFEALGTPPFGERGAVTDEYLRAFRELWSSPRPEFEGRYVRFSGIRFGPKPVQQPHPPIWVGGQSRAAIRRAARLGDGWHPVGAVPAATLEPEELAEDLARLYRYAEQEGRNPAELAVSMKAPLYDAAGTQEGPRRRFSGSNDAILEDVHTYAQAGVSHIIFDIRGRDLSEALERLDWFAGDIIAKAE